MKKIKVVLMNKNHGFSLIGTLVGAVVFTMLLGGSAKFVEMTLQASNASKAVLTENNLKQTIAQGLEKKCNTNKDDATLNHESLVGDPATGIGVLKDSFTLPGGIKQGEDFKGGIEVVKMELQGVATESTRDFVVYYKMKGLGKLNAQDPSKCLSADVTGCFEQRCTVNYHITDNHCTSSVDCHSFDGSGGGGGPPPCYKVDKTETEGRKTLVGCEGPNTATGLSTTAIGFGAGKVSTGEKNTFVGANAGNKNTTGERNTFVGESA